ncbi:MAG: S8 family serine peptidase [Euryarchaeota archaeon]|nr:S8 family serine peptidase [Euryarchaeota archaeon]
MKISKKSRIGVLLAVALLLSVVFAMAVSSVPLEDSQREKQMDKFEEIALQHVSQTHGIPVEQLRIAHKTQAYYRLTDQKFWCAKVVDKKSDKGYEVHMDLDGNIVEDIRKAEKEEQEAYANKYGKLAPDLYERLQKVTDPNETIKVGIWLTPIGSEKIVDEITSKYPDVKTTKGKPMPGTDMEKYDKVYKEIMAAKEEAGALKVKPIRDYLESKGFTVKCVSNVPPIVAAELPKSEILTLQEREDVDTIYLSKVNKPEINTAVPTIRAHKAWNEGYKGTGRKVAIVEGDGVDFSNPYLNGYMRPGQTDEGSHATECAGVAASNHPTTYRGVAYDATILSANADSWSDDDLINASKWALSEDADVLSCSFGHDTNLQMDYLDRYYDSVVWEKWRAVVKSAGNRGCWEVTWPFPPDWEVTTPGLGWNVITVGGTDDSDTTEWSDDGRYPCSSYNDPISPHGDRDKPEVSAVAERILSTETESYKNSCDSWISVPSCGGVPPQGWAGTSYAAPAVAGEIAVLISKSSTLRAWPEATKAIVMATAIHDTYNGGLGHGCDYIDDQEGTGTVDVAQAYKTVDNGWYGLGSYVMESDFPMDINFYASEGEKVRFVTCWDSHTDWEHNTSKDILKADLDLKIKAPNGNTMGTSNSWGNSFETVEFTAPMSGTYTATITEWRFDAGWEWLAWAWSRTSLPEMHTFQGSVVEGDDSVKHNFNVPFESNVVYTTLNMPSGTDFDLSVWDNLNRRTGGWTSTESHNSYEIPNSTYSGYLANPEWVKVSPPVTSGTWKTGCYAFSGSGTYSITVDITP